MLTTTDAEICGTDGVWRKLYVSMILGQKHCRIGCAECKGAVRAHRAPRTAKPALTLNTKCDGMAARDVMPMTAPVYSQILTQFFDEPPPELSAACH